MGVPIGLINASWGGTPAEAWTSRPALEADAAFDPYLKQWDEIIADFPRASDEYKKQLAQWKTDTAQAEADGKPAPRAPTFPMGPNHPHRPATLFNGMIAPLLPFSMRGAIWYQGESNSGRADTYYKLLPAMIRDWRAQWKEGDFPFYFVQLPNFGARNDLPVDDTSAWAKLREAQLQTLALPNTGMAVTIDVGEADNIHPRDKQTVGFRLAQAALAGTYKQKVAGSGPVFESMKIEEGKARLKFKNVDGGLKSKSAEALSKPAEPIAAAAEYPDLPSGHWAYSALDKIIKAGLTERIPTCSSNANVTYTRYEFAVAIARTMERMASPSPEIRKPIDLAARNALTALQWEFGVELRNLGVRLGSLEARKGAPDIIPREGCDLQGFAIAGEDHKWAWANAQIWGDEIIVSSEAVPNPVAVRYAWGNNPPANLYNGAGLPASPFRTDDGGDINVGK